MVLLKRSMLLAIHSNLATSNPVPQGAHEVRSRAMSGTARVVANSSKPHHACPITPAFPSPAANDSIMRTHVKFAARWKTFGKEKLSAHDRQNAL